MNDQEKDKQLEHMLDSLLAQYSLAEPRPGLETRILANIRRSSGGKTRRMTLGRWWVTAAATTAFTAALIALFVVYGGRPQPPGKKTRKRVQAQSNPEFVTSFQGRTAAPHSAEHRRLTRLTEVKKAVFPTPSPLSQQERLLLRYLAGTPRHEVVSQSHPDPPPDAVAFADDLRLPRENGNRSTTSNQ